jgi:hypothetical protein
MSEGIAYKFPPFSLVEFMGAFGVADDEFLYEEYKNYLKINVGCHWYPDGSATMDEWFARILIEEILNIKQGEIT